MKGKTCIVTGGTTGIGFETACRLAAMGARILLVGRRRDAGEAALARLNARVPGAAVEIYYADLARHDEVVRLSTELLAAAPRIDVLLNNAGAIFSQRQMTEDGIERTLALNHLGYFLLTQLLRERLLTSAPARIINVASEAHRGATLDFTDLQYEKRYSGWKAYQRSKLFNILFTREQARRLAGTGVTVNCLHPGFVATSFGDNNEGLFRIGLALGKRVMAISVERGAETPLYLAASPAVASATGLYFDKCRERAPTAAAQDDAAAARLWQESIRLTRLPVMS